MLTLVSRISLTRPQLASQVESLLVRMGQQGQIRGQVTDEALKGLLEQVSAHQCLVLVWAGLVVVRGPLPLFARPASSTQWIVADNRYRTHRNPRPLRQCSRAQGRVLLAAELPSSASVMTLTLMSTTCSFH